jgi:O-antigen ligase
MDTFLPLFPVYKYDPNPFPQAHNDWLQLAWETGLVGFLIFSAYCTSLIARLYRHSASILIAGLVIIGVNMIFHFPWRMTQTVFLMVAFVAYCEKYLKERGAYEQQT